MLGDELRELLRAVVAKLRKPPPDRRVGAAPAGDRQPGVRHVADQGVLERVFDVVAEARRGSHQDQASPLEAIQLGGDLLTAHGVDERLLPEDAPHDRRFAEDAAFDLRKRVDPRREQPIDRVGQDDGVAIPLGPPAAFVQPKRSGLNEAADDLLHEERVALGRIQDLVLHGPWELGRRQQVCDQLGAVRTA